MSSLNSSLLTLPRFFSAEECLEMISRAEAAGFEEAKVNIRGQQVMRKEVRNNDRVFLSDVGLARQLFLRVHPHLPQVLGNYHMVGLNELFRVYRYHPGQEFRPHRDGAFFRNEVEHSVYTLLVYLNDQFVGGETTFEEEEVQPAIGLAVAFRHELIHAGRPVLSGTKYVLRTDVMYHRPKVIQEGM